MALFVDYEKYRVVNGLVPDFATVEFPLIVWASEYVATWSHRLNASGCNQYIQRCGT